MRAWMLTAIACATFLVPGNAQDDKKKDNDPAVKDAIKELSAAYRAKDDDVARGKMTDLLTMAKDAGPKDRAKIVKEIAKSFGQRRKEGEDGLYRAATAALGAIGPEAAKELQKAFDAKIFTKNVEMRAEIVEAVGKTKDHKSAKFLVDLLDYKDDPVIAATAKGMSYYHGEPIAVRLEMVEKMIRALEVSDNNARDLNNVRAQERYAVIGSPLIASLQKLTGQDVRKPLEWVQWWNDNKKRTDW